MLLALLPSIFAADAPPSEVVEVSETATRGPDALATSASVTVLVPGETTAQTADVASLIESAAGTNVQRLGGLGDFAAVSIRGASLRQVEVFVDGVPLNPDGADVVNLAELPLGAFQRIEVWRGNTPVSLGAAPIGGAVNLVTREEAGAKVGVAQGSWDTARATAFGGGKLGPAAQAPRVQAFAEAFRSEGDYVYFADNATLYNLLDDHLLPRGNNDKLQLSGFARATVPISAWTLGLTAVPLFREEGLAGQSNLPTTSARLETGRTLSSADAQVAGGNWQARVLGWHLYRADTLSDPEGELDGLVREDTSVAHTAGLRATATWAPAAWMVPAATLSLRRESIEVNSTVLGDDPERARLAGTLALGVDVRLLGERLLLSPAVHLTGQDNRSLGTVSAAGGTADASALLGSADPRLGVLVRPLRWLSFKGNAGSYLRTPDLTELFGHHGSMKGNPELLPERGWQFDVGLRAEGPRSGPLLVSGDLGAFWLLSEDRIVWVQNSQKSMSPVNFGETWVQGVESSLTLSAWELLDSETSLTWQLSRNLTEGSAYANNELPRTPELALWQSVSVHWLDRIRCGYTFNFTSPNYWDAGNLYRSAPRTLHGAFIRTRPTERWPTLELSGLNLADSLTEVVPRDPADADDPSRAVAAISDFAGYPLPGRTFLLSVIWTP